MYTGTVFNLYDIISFNMYQILCLICTRYAFKQCLISTNYATRLHVTYLICTRYQFVQHVCRRDAFYIVLFILYLLLYSICSVLDLQYILFKICTRNVFVYCLICATQVSIVCLICIYNWYSCLCSKLKLHWKYCICTHYQLYLFYFAYVQTFIQI